MKKYYALLFLLVFCFQGFANESIVFPMANTESPDCATLVLTSSSTSLAQTICQNTVISTITCVVGNGATGAVATGLPDGVGYTFNSSSNVLTIFGAPNASGIYSFTITTTGGACPAFLNGNITVNPNASLSLTSAPGTSNQIVCENFPIIPITYTFGDSTTGVFVSGLPPGITGIYLSETQTCVITGTSAVTGIFPYAVTAGNGCASAFLGGTITVLPNAVLTLTSPGTENQTVCAEMPIVPITYHTENGVTGVNAVGLPDGVTASILVGEVVIVGVPTEPGFYNYMITTVGNCSSDSEAGTIVVNPSPVLNLHCQGGFTPVDMMIQWDAVPGATSYNYSYSINNGPLVSGATPSPGTLITPLSVGQSVTLTVHSVDGGVQCFVPQTITCVFQPLSDQTFDEVNFGYYPNPIVDVLYLEYDRPFSNIAIYNTIGQAVFCQHIDADKAAIDLSALQNGVYFARIEVGAVVKNIRLVKK
ncbi:T9SS type A sorting domain-containing protein [Flavobacterium sp.]|uniref:T9SS type A sorting domain-containing protein n=1 Tax=Flavobacterium sp. TaxID=239 RepID=UPI0039E4E690